MDDHTLDDLLTDTRTVWPDGQNYMWCSQLLDALRTIYPRSYGDWDVRVLGDSLRARGIKTKQINRRIDGRQYAKSGITLAQLGEASSAQRSVVYFVERDGFVKIGTTRNLVGRIYELNRGSSALSGMVLSNVNLLALMPGDAHVERAMHRMFADLRYDGEWFLHDDPLASFIRAAAGAEWRVP